MPVVLSKPFGRVTKKKLLEQVSDALKRVELPFTVEEIQRSRFRGQDYENGAYFWKAMLKHNSRDIAHCEILCFYSFNDLEGYLNNGHYLTIQKRGRATGINSLSDLEIDVVKGVLPPKVVKPTDILKEVQWQKPDVRHSSLYLITCMGVGEKQGAALTKLFTKHISDKFICPKDSPFYHGGKWSVTVDVNYENAYWNSDEHKLADFAKDITKLFE